MVVALEHLSHVESVLQSNIFGGSKNRYLEDSRIERCLQRGKVYSGVFAMHMPTCISITACLREGVASEESPGGRW